VEAEDLRFVDLYSCFPVAVAAHARAVGLAQSQPTTFTGGMRFAGGPFNNYALHATAQLAQHLRGAPGAKGLVSCVSGVLTKHGFGVWATGSKAPPYALLDVSGSVAAACLTRDVVASFTGRGAIAGYTVLHEGGRPNRAVVVVDTDDGRRAIAQSADAGVMRVAMREEACGRTVDIVAGEFALTTRVSA
jgi:acetyl-CoA C-acetyltransferase